jgi:hypothetical protein
MRFMNRQTSARDYTPRPHLQLALCGLNYATFLAFLLIGTSPAPPWMLATAFCYVFFVAPVVMAIIGYRGFIGRKRYPFKAVMIIGWLYALAVPALTLLYVVTVD